MASFAPERLRNQLVVVRDRTGMEYRGVVKEVLDEAFVLANGDGTVTIVARSYVVSTRILHR